MKILVSGSTGLIGSTLIPRLTSGGHQIISLRRGTASGSDEISWDPAAPSMSRERLEGLDAVIHLAGEPIASGRWSPEKKDRIRNSRVKGTRLLSETLSRLEHPPSVFLSASAIGYYGNRGDEILREGSGPGTGFLGEVGQQWEEATLPAIRKNIRVVHLRTGLVLSLKGGALKMMLPPFQMGVGGILGNGRQYMSWITLEDEVGAIEHLLTHQEVQGPVNLVAPEAVTNSTFTQLLGKILSRPTLIPVPAFAVRALFGELADEALLASTRVEPAKLTASGYPFQDPSLESALRKLLDRPAPAAL